MVAGERWRAGWGGERGGGGGGGIAIHPSYIIFQTIHRVSNFSSEDFTDAQPRVTNRATQELKRWRAGWGGGRGGLRYTPRILYSQTIHRVSNSSSEDFTDAQPRVTNRAIQELKRIFSNRTLSPGAGRKINLKLSECSMFLRLVASTHANIYTTRYLWLECFFLSFFFYYY